jgi:hypothetical protein
MRKLRCPTLADIATLPSAISVQTYRRHIRLVENPKNRPSDQYAECRAPLFFGQSGVQMVHFKNQSRCEEKRRSA